MKKTRKLTTMALLIALSVVLVMTVRIVVFNPLEYDAGDIPIMISGFLFGPMAGLLITVVASAVQGLTVSAQSGPWGILMHVIATGTFVVVASLIYHRNKTLKSAIIGMVCGMAAVIVVMIPANLIVQPLWNGIPVQAVKDMIWPVLVPFNALKFAVNGVVTFLVYKPISKLVKLPSGKKTGLEES